MAKSGEGTPARGNRQARELPDASTPKVSPGNSAKGCRRLRYASTPSCPPLMPGQSSSGFPQATDPNFLPQPDAACQRKRRINGPDTRRDRHRQEIRGTDHLWPAEPKACSNIPNIPGLRPRLRLDLD